jgi:hypothetical protein
MAFHKRLIKWSILKPDSAQDGFRRAREIVYFQRLLFQVDAGDVLKRVASR